MTVLPYPKQLNEKDTDNKVIATCPTITSGGDSFSSGAPDGVQGTYTYFKNLLSPLSHIRGTTVEPDRVVSDLYSFFSQTRFALSMDKKFIYLHGHAIGGSNIPWNFANKIDIAKNELVWSTVNPASEGLDPETEALFAQNNPTACAIDLNENLLIGSIIGTPPNVQTHLLDGKTGDILFTTSLVGMSRFAVASNGFIYVSLGWDSTDLDKVHKLNSDLTPALDESEQPIKTYPQDPTHEDNALRFQVCTDCVLSHDGSVLFVCGSSTVAVSLWALDPDDLSILASSDILTRQGSSIPRMKLMPDGSLIVVTKFDETFPTLDHSKLTKITYDDGVFTEVIAENFPIISETINWIEPYITPFNYIFISFVDSALIHGIRIYEKDGSFVQQVLISGAADVIFPEPKKAIYMNQTMEPENEPAEPQANTDFTEIDYPDMCCMLNDEIPRYDVNSTYDVGDIFYYEGVGSWELSETIASYYNNIQSQGVWEVIEAITTPNDFFEHYTKLVNLTRTIPCQNPNWDQHTGFGGQAGGGLVVNEVQTGIDNSPQFYTISLQGLLIASDGGVSPYNGNVILKKIPGMWGAYASYDPETKLQINFNVNSVLLPNFVSLGGGVSYPNGMLEKIRAYIVQDDPTQYDIFRLFDSDDTDDITIENIDLTDTFVTGRSIKIEGSSEQNDGTYGILDSIFSGGNTIIELDNFSLNDFEATGGTVELVNLSTHMVFQADFANSNLGSISYPETPFEYFHDATPTNISSELADEDPNVAYSGTCSLYPGRYEEWDNTTKFVENQIVAWEGYLYQANSDNQGSEPPSGWSQISGPV